MARTLMALFGFALVVSGSSAQEPKANALTKEEAEQGWILLFDGKKPLELLIEGDSEIVDGVLVVGGARPSGVQIKPKLSSRFEVRLEYRTEGAKPIQVKTAYRGFLEGGSGSRSLDRRSKDKDEWIEIIYSGSYDPKTDQRSVGSQFRAVGEAAFKKQQIGGGNRERNITFSFDIPAGSKFYLRNLKLKSDPVGPDLLLPIITGVVLLLAILGLYFVIRLRRKKEPKSADEPGA